MVLGGTVPVLINTGEGGDDTYEKFFSIINCSPPALLFECHSFSPRVRLFVSIREAVNT